MEKQKPKNPLRSCIREYNKTLAEITKLQTELERAERRARQYLRQIYN